MLVKLFYAQFIAQARLGNPFSQKYIITIPIIMKQESQFTGQIVLWKCSILLFSCRLDRANFLDI